MKFKLSTKLVGGFMIMVALLMAVGGVSYMSLNDMKAGSEGIKFSADYDDAIMTVIINIVKQQDAFTDYALTGEEDVLSEIRQFSQNIDRGLEHLREFTKSTKEMKAVDDLEKEHDDFEDTGYKMGKAYRISQSEGNVVMSEFDAAVEDIEKQMETVEEAAMVISTQKLAASEAAASRALKAVASISVVAIIVGLILGIVLSGSITRPVTALANATELMAEGDLTQKVNVATSDEVGEMAHSFNQMSARLSEMMREIRDSANNLASASEQISSATEELAAGADNQSRQASEVATAMEEMASSVQGTFTNAEKSLEISKKTSETATKGGDIISQTMAGMSRIEKAVSDSAQKVHSLGGRSKEIGKIVEVIKDIAAQTNLLALNAAIEANRAGEHGRGFEVVAEEIRKLAEKSAGSTLQITEIIEEIQSETESAVDSMSSVTKEVETGTELSNETGDSLKEIIRQVQDTLASIELVAETSKQQASVSDQVAASMESISTIVKESAASSEEIAQTAQELARLGDNLQRLTERFSI